MCVCVCPLSKNREVCVCSLLSQSGRSPTTLPQRCIITLPSLFLPDCGITRGGKSQRWATAGLQAPSPTTSGSESPRRWAHVDGDVLGRVVLRHSSSYLSCGKKTPVRPRSEPRALCRCVSEQKLTQIICILFRFTHTGSRCTANINSISTYLLIIR